MVDPPAKNKITQSERGVSAIFIVAIEIQLSNQSEASVQSPSQAVIGKSTRARLQQILRRSDVDACRGIAIGAEICKPSVRLPADEPQRVGAGETGMDGHRY